MQIEDVISSEQDGHSITNLASAFGLTPDQARKASHVLITALAQRIERNTLSRGGLADVVALLGDPDAGRAMTASDMASAATNADGNAVLDKLIGSKHVSRGIAAGAARATGVDAGVLERMLPVIASMLIGGLQRAAQPILREKLGGMQGIGDLLPLPGDPPRRMREPLPSPAQDDYEPQVARPEAPPADRGARDPIRKGRGVLLPLPGDNGPVVHRRTGYDDLSDAVRRGGSRGDPGPVPSQNTIGGLIRSILGGLLGFKNRGLIQSLIYLFLTRWFLNFIRRIFSRVVLGR